MSDYGFPAFARRIAKLRVRRLRYTVTEFAKAKRIVSAGSSATPGRYSDANFPFQRGIQDACGDPHVNKITIVLPSQVGKTEMAINIILYFTAHEASPIMWCFASEKAKKKFVKRIRREIKASPEWAALLQGHGDGISADGIDFIGCAITWAMASSSSDLRETPARVTVADEVEIFPTDLNGEGSPLKLLQARSRTFADSIQILLSTPTLPAPEGTILTSYAESDMREWHVPCLACGHYHEFSFENVKWEKPDSMTHADFAIRVKNGDAPVWYECPSPTCKHRHSTQRDKIAMNARGKWVITRPEVKDHAGFRMEVLGSNSTKVTFAAVAAEHFEARHKQLRGDDAAMQTFHNHFRAKGFSPKRMQIVEASIAARANPDMARGVVPPWADFFTLGADVQHDRIYWVRSAWRKADQRRHIFDWGILEGRIDDAAFRKGPLQALVDEVVEWQGGLKKGRARLACFDSGDGTVTLDVYAFARQFQGGRVVPIKGGNIAAGRLWKRSADEEAEHRGGLVMLDVDRIKDWWSKLMQREGESAPTFAAEVVFDPEFQRHLCSQARDPKGHWDMRAGYGEDHWLDAGVYDVAAGMLCGLVREPDGPRHGPRKPVVRHAAEDRFGRSGYR